LAAVQYWPARHEPRAVAVHATQRPEATSHTGLLSSLEAQSMLSRQRVSASIPPSPGASGGRRPPPQHALAKFLMVFIRLFFYFKTIQSFSSLIQSSILSFIKMFRKLLN
jgi:hypothetical protein